MKAYALQLSLAFSFLLGPCLADVQPYSNSAEYDKGDYGRWVTQTFLSSQVIAPVLNVRKPFTECDDGSYLFVAPRGGGVAKATPMILDAAGSLVWAAEQHYGNVYNLMVQEYHGEPYLTFWAGDDAVGGHGVGNYYMLDRHYELYRKLAGANGLGADLHCFTITAESTSLSTLYEKVEKDLSGVNQQRAKGWVWESIFQEVDIETGEVIFQWRASEHVNIAESYTVLNEATEKAPWDFFHINMIEKDAAGNYLVSSRHLRSVLYVSGTTGKVLWQLGGRGNSFEDLSGGAATRFIGQHDAHWGNADQSVITLFDNGADWGGDYEKGSTGMRVEVDLEKMTARLDLKLQHPDRIISASQGSYQTLPSGNILLGYGFNGAMAEFSPNGTLLCDAYFGPSSRFTQGDVQSYRDLKFNWTAFPKTTPNLVWVDGSLYVSWNGATEVKGWLFEDSYTSKQNWRQYDLAARAGFETKLSFGGGRPIRRYVRVVAMDHAGEHLGASLVLDLGSVATDWESEAAQLDAGAGSAGKTEQDEHHNTAHAEDGSAGDKDDQTSELRKEVEDIQMLLVLAFLALVSGLLVVWMAFSCRRRRNMFGWNSVPQDDEEVAMDKMELGSGEGGSFWQRLHPRLESAQGRLRDGVHRLLRPKSSRATDRDIGEGMRSDVELPDVH
ncbi:hypothetical protein LTR36_004200 [Oleoguttula mirabilis]|uniref:ASST-domain-containing protein n=1 Tax=Oleoguttula mirabilis TaxID=1507867 RepID=A0AAV9JJF9_9PEZI|nr:hypothetical protein LTR36_004200 [Oleoguttula mirabilis]